jgi:hypothetical protein
VCKVDYCSLLCKKLVTEQGNAIKNMFYVGLKFISSDFPQLKSFIINILCVSVCVCMREAKQMSSRVCMREYIYIILFIIRVRLIIIFICVCVFYKLRSCVCACLKLSQKQMIRSYAFMQMLLFFSSQISQ